MYYRESALKLSDMVASIAPACDVTISVSEDEETIGTTAANDWLEVDSSILLRRITGENAAAKQEWEKLVELRDEEGRIYGRARIDPYPIASRGLLTVDGLAASKVSSIAGILIGTEITASRNSAIPIVPAHVLAAWASEQAIAFGTAAIPDEEKARVAAIVASFGGDVAELPVVRWEGEWMNSKRFSEAMQLEEEVTLHTDTITHEEDDVVTKREFEASFEVYGKVAQTVGGSLAYEWVSKVTQGKGATPARIIERLLVAVWGEVEEDDDTMVVGDVNGSEIYRTVTVYKRGEAEELLSGDEM